MTKRIESQIKEIHQARAHVKFTLGTLALVGFCTFLIVIATFTQLSFYHYSISMNALLHPIDFFYDPSNHILQTKYYEYIPQIPVIIYVAALLGPIYSLLAVMAYITIGLTLIPVFALGGGVKYILQYNFGYILAYLPAVFIVCRNLHKEFNYKTVTKATVISVVTIHVIGMFYAIIMGLIRGESYDFLLGWIVLQSFSKLIYDLIFGFIAIFAAKLTRKMLWIIMG